MTNDDAWPIFSDDDLSTRNTSSVFKLSANDVDHDHDDSSVGNQAILKRIARLRAKVPQRAPPARSSSPKSTGMEGTAVGILSPKKETEKNKIKKRKPVKQKDRYYLQCDECEALFDRKSLYEEHEVLHEKGLGVKCEICGWLCKREFAVVMHKAYWHPKGPEDRKLPTRIRVMPKRP